MMHSLSFEEVPFLLPMYIFCITFPGPALTPFPSNIFFPFFPCKIRPCECPVCIHDLGSINMITNDWTLFIGSPLPLLPVAFLNTYEVPGMRVPPWSSNPPLPPPIFWSFHGLCPLEYLFPFATVPGSLIKVWPVPFAFLTKFPIPVFPPLSLPLSLYSSLRCIPWTVAPLMTFLPPPQLKFCV